ncbi:hypothetical protein [Maribacter stanieri]|uniref:Uncharacterized protein n=1 Tax=Maribacter stanieri TaxID=440514 RepID=A0A1I6J2K1_9FLAO|nr:hypothetical protein [Maribacter stanieri]SFR73245.1 hypothetical protein SAMN04488010_2219 [Maribacter stanieri]
MKNGKNFITSFFVALFLLFNVASLHAFAHQDDDSAIQHCEVCHISIAVNFIPLIETETIALPPVDFYFTEQKINDKALFVSLNKQYLSSFLFTRPPPLFT